MMDSLLKIGKDDLKDICMETAGRLGMSSIAIEKDLWVCFMLHTIFSNPGLKGIFHFKGGTSLSKAYSLIQRFSEDIDLILDWRTLGFSEDEPWNDRSATAQGKFNKNANEKAAQFIKSEILPILKSSIEKDLGQNADISIDDAVLQTIVFRYPNIYESRYLSPSIRLEIGPLAAWTPTEKKEIRPYIQEAFPGIFQDLSISVDTVLPERTFWEKATVLHHEANRPQESSMPARYARHYYDMFMMAGTDVKEKAFSNIGLLEDVIRFKEKFYPRKWAEYGNAVPPTIKLIPPGFRMPSLKQDYESMKEMLYGNIPTFDEVMERIARIEGDMHELPYNPAL